MRRTNAWRYLVKSAVILLLILSVAGCQTRSISDSGYRDGYYNSARADRKELTEFDVLGIDGRESISEEDIANAFARETDLNLEQGSAIMLIQSGARFPDESMLQAMESHFKVTPFSGIRDSESAGASYSRALRLAAGQAGLDYIFCYWGVLETAEKNLATKSVSWVPVVGRMVPDKHQTMRIRLKMAVVDARTGQWAMLAPDDVEDGAISMKLTRESSDQHQVALLKEAGYQGLVDVVSERYMRR